MALAKIRLGLSGVQTGMGYREARDNRMGAPAGPTAEAQNQDLAVTVILEVLGMPPPAVKILATRTALQRRKNGQIQPIGVAVALFGDQKV
jgi:hypothetical protein